MPDVQNVSRRGGAYWWCRTLTWWDGNARPITLSLSLGTKNLGVARHRAAAMTAQVYEVIWSAFARTGVVAGMPSMAYADEHFGELTDEQRVAARWLIGSMDLRASLLRETAQRLEALGIACDPTNMALAMRLMLDARSQAVRELRLGIDTGSGAAVPAMSSERQPAPIIADHDGIRPVALDASRIPEKWRDVGPIKAAELRIESNPAMLQHRKDGKRAATQVGEQTLRQIRWAAVLLPKSMNSAGSVAGIRPFWTCTYEDIVKLDSWFGQLPITCGKSPRDREPETTLQAIRE